MGLTSPDCFLRKSLKWWRKLFFWGLKISLINSYILYKTTKEQRKERPISHLQYVKTLVKQLTGNFGQTHQASTSCFEDIRFPYSFNIRFKLGHCVLRFSTAVVKCK